MGSMPDTQDSPQTAKDPQNSPQQTAQPADSPALSDGVRSTAGAAVFFDRDNTLIVGADYLGDPLDVMLMPGAAACVAGMRRLGYRVVTISNQSGVARGFYDEEAVHAVNEQMEQALREGNEQAVVDRHEFCPHHPQASVEAYRVDCECRKPKMGMLLRAAEALDLDLSRSWLVGDAPRDIEAGAAAGCRTVLLSVPDLEQSPAALAEHRVAPDFTAESLTEVLEIIQRETIERGDEPERVAEKPAGEEPEGEEVLEELVSEEPAVAEAAPPAPPASAAVPARQASSDQVAQATAQILDDLRRSRQTPEDDFNWLRLLAGVMQVMALAALVMGLIDSRSEFWISIAIFLQVMTLTLVMASK